jgi:hypothetical protein
MPPTINAIDEMTTSARNVALLIWSHTPRTASCVAKQKSAQERHLPCECRSRRFMTRKGAAQRDRVANNLT